MLSTSTRVKPIPKDKLLNKLDILLKQRDNFLNDVKYKTKEYESPNDERLEKKYKPEDLKYNAEIPSSWLESKKVKPNFYIEFYNGERIKIEHTFTLECYPPIFQFENQTNNCNVPYKWVKNKSIKLLVLIKDNEFAYQFDNQREFTSAKKIDERFKDIVTSNIVDHRFERNFCEFSISKLSTQISPDSYRKILFAIHGENLIFRSASFSMIMDDCYKYIEEVEYRNSED